MDETSLPEGRKIGHLLLAVAVAAVAFALIRNPEFLMTLASFGPLGMLAIVGWVLIVWFTVRATIGKPKVDDGASEDAIVGARESGGDDPIG